MRTLGDFRRVTLWTAAALSLALSAPSALAADDQIDAATCEPNMAESSTTESPDMLDPMLRGVALADLDIPEGRMVSDYLRAKGVLPLNEVLSTSIVELHMTHVVVD